MKFSLRKKVIIFIILMAMAFGATAVIATRNVIEGMVNDSFTSRATEIANTVAVSLDPDEVLALREAVMDIYNSIDESERYNSENWGTPEFDEYQKNFESIYELPEYKHILAELKKIQNQNDVDCLYLNYLDTASVAVIYLCDAAEEDACPPGCFDQYNMDSEENQMALNHPEIGYPAIVTNTEAYGWLVSVSVPIFTKDSNLVCYSSVDISMDMIRKRQLNITLFIMLIMFVLSAVICVLAYYLINRFVVKPINLLSDTAVNYTKEEDSVIRHGFSDLSIDSSDEIGVLADSMKQMESDINDYYANLLAAREEVNRMGEIATRDALTGIRNKRAYDEMISDLNKEISIRDAVFGIAMADLNYLKTINDDYGHDKGNIAIKKLCHLICITFSHSPVFRIGGDEFAIILRNHDLENVDTLIAQFDSTLKEYAADNSLEPWEQPSAAIGYSVFRPGEDKTAEDVFKRADNLMYDHKREMKNGAVR